jgi:Ca2+-binding RTX toxin-like protein
MPILSPSQYLKSLLISTPSHGHDTLTGGTGADYFYFNSPWEGVDISKDFKYWEGDKIGIIMNGFDNLTPSGGIGSVNHSHFTFDLSTKQLSFLGIHFATLENISSSSSFVVSRDINFIFSYLI